MDWIFRLKQDVRKSAHWRLIQSIIERHLEVHPGLSNVEDLLRLPEVQEVVADFGNQLRKKIAAENREKGTANPN